MRIVRNLLTITERFPYPVLTLGNFDGVHLGHQAIFKKIVERAREISGTSIVFTFEPHPLKVLAPDRSPKLLNTFEGKMKLLARTGIDIVICVEFTPAFAGQNPEDFARVVLHEQIGVKEVYVGYDYAFGKSRKGSIASLRKMGHVCGFSVSVVDAVRINNRVVSSSAARDLVSSGKVAEAAELLGRYYSIEGDVVHGSHRGHELGFPTANLRTRNELLPANGVYAVFAEIDGRRHQGAASIGVRPTFDSGPLSIEVYLFNFDGDLYGKQMEVFFVHHIREEKKFPDVQSLISQMQKDVEESKSVLLRS
jgi:riboflavin kinase/FMN adenylyltransferase